MIRRNKQEKANAFCLNCKHPLKDIKSNFVFIEYKLFTTRHNGINGALSTVHITVKRFKTIGYGLFGYTG